MGANDNKKNKTEVIDLSEEQEKLFSEALFTLNSLANDIRAVGTPIREFALGLTKLEEAEMWIERGFDMLDIEPEEPDEDDDIEDDEDEDDDTEAEDVKGNKQP